MMWTLEQMVLFPKMKEVSMLPYEVSVALYITPTDVLALKTYDKIGDTEGVELPDIKEVIKNCKKNRTRQIILVHNHPYINGVCDSTPSANDLYATRVYAKLLKREGIILLDHIIVSPSGYFSFKQNNLL